MVLQALMKAQVRATAVVVVVPTHRVVQRLVRGVPQMQARIPVQVPVTMTAVLLQRVVVAVVQAAAVPRIKVQQAQTKVVRIPGLTAQATVLAAILAVVIVQGHRAQAPTTVLPHRVVTVLVRWGHRPRVRVVRRQRARVAVAVLVLTVALITPPVAEEKAQGKPAVSVAPSAVVVLLQIMTMAPTAVVVARSARQMTVVMVRAVMVRIRRLIKLVRPRQAAQAAKQDKPQVQVRMGPARMTDRIRMRVVLVARKAGLVVVGLQGVREVVVSVVLSRTPCVLGNRPLAAIRNCRSKWAHWPLSPWSRYVTVA